MAISSAQVTVTTAATLLVAADMQAEQVNFHSSSGTIYLGDANVTSSTGYRMDNGDKVVLQNHETPIYGITSTGSATMSVLIISK
jgi:hypothetical protein